MVVSAFTKDKISHHLIYYLPDVDHESSGIHFLVKHSTHFSSCGLYTFPFSPFRTMTLDVLQFIDGKGGNAQEIRESQKKRGLSVEIVDEVIQMYADWVKRAHEMTLGGTRWMLT